MLRFGSALNGEYMLAIFPLVICLTAFVLVRAVFAGQWRTVRAKPFFKGRFARYASGKYWLPILAACAGWAVLAGLWIAFTQD